MKTILDFDFSNKTALIRVDFNVPLDSNLEVIDNTRILSAKPTILKILKDGGSCVLMSHLGRPKGKNFALSLHPVAKKLAQIMNKNIIFLDDCIGEKVKSKLNNSVYGEIYLLENLRFYKEEAGGDSVFSKELASLADVYINDAFGAAHRVHASTAIIAGFFPNNKYFGFLLNKEIESLERALSNPERPLTAIIGGAKITGKIDVITTLFEKADNIIIGGGMAYTFAKAMGGEIGKSLVEEDRLVLAKQLIYEAKKKGVNLLLPIDSVNADSFNNRAKTNFSNILSIKPDYMGLDIGSKSIAKFLEKIKLSKTLIWNGPMGIFEMKNFENGTKKIGEAICLATENGAFSLVGGGDSVAALKKFNLADRVSYISTGGGAMLEYLKGKHLPGVIAILN